jgi:hypothetical protein
VLLGPPHSVGPGQRLAENLREQELEGASGLVLRRGRDASGIGEGQQKS